MIEQAGFARDDDGYYYRNGELFQLDFVTYPERAELPLMAEVIQHQLEEVGIKVGLEIMEYGQAADRRDTGQFHMYLMGRNMGFISWLSPLLTLVSMERFREVTGCHGKLQEVSPVSTLLQLTPNVAAENIRRVTVNQPGAGVA